MAVFCKYCSERSSFIKDEETLGGVRYYRALTKFSSPCILLVISKINTSWGLDQLYLCSARVYCSYVFVCELSRFIVTR
jgi:hypothetical protein